jgi:phosphoribosylamine-glycine ligase
LGKKNEGRMSMEGGRSQKVVETAENVSREQKKASSDVEFPERQ